MHMIGMRLKDNLEVERYLRRSRTVSRKEQDYPDFPYIWYTLDFTRFLEDRTPWHRHRELEMVEVTSGAINIRTSKSSYICSAGEVCFIGAQVLRQISPEPLGSHAVCELNLFFPELINGNWGNAFDSRYVSPILDCRDMDLFYFSRQNEQTDAVRSHLQAARRICDAKKYGYEFDVRREMSEVWKLLYQAAEPRLHQRRTLSDRSEERMQAMMSFIQSHYAEEISLADIANAALISERECFRCFKSTLGVTPTRYLQNYRVRMAARMLLESGDTVQEISEKNGFRDSSYFGRVFQKTMHITPTAFRRRHQFAGEEEAEDDE